MTLRALLLSSLLLVAGLTGCIGGEEDTPPAEDDGPKKPTVPTEPVETPIGTTCEACSSAPPVANGTDADMHSHDYWGGETRKVIASFDSGLIPIPLFPDGKAAGTAIADYDIPEPELVYEGTSQLEVVFTKVCVWGTEVSGFLTGNTEQPCPAPHPVITIYVDYLTAADEPGAFRQAGQATPGQPLVIPVAPTEADMPHQTKSLWLFRIYTGEANAFTYNVTITAVKGNSVVDWPPHPDVYADRTERTVLEGDFVTESKGLAEYYLYGTDANWQYPDRVITYGTEKVEVEITFGTIEAGGATPTSYHLDFKNASYLTKVGNGDSAGGRLEDPASDGTTYRFSIPVDAQGMDTPYASKSRWGFRFMARFDTTECPDIDQSLQQGCQVVPYRLSYHMKIVAYGRSAASEAPAA